MSHGHAVAVTGIGIVSPGGPDTDSTWTAVCSGQATARLDPRLAGLPVRISCRVPDFDPVARLGTEMAHRSAPFSQLALSAADEAVACAGLDPGGWDGTRVAVVLGSAMGGSAAVEEQTERMLFGTRTQQPTDSPRLAVSPWTIPWFLPNMAAGQISLRMRAAGPVFGPNSACASGATAIGLGCDLLRAHRCDIVLAGGADAAVHRLSAAGFARLNALSKRNDDPSAASRPFDNGRDGFVLAEGAAVLVLERVADARARRAQVMALMAGYGAAADAHHPTAPHPEGSGLRRAVEAALADAGLAPSQIDHVNAHATSTPAGDAAEAMVIAEMFPHRPAVTAVKGVLGHTLGAAGAMAAAISVLTIVHNRIPPTANVDTLDERIELDIVTGRPRAAPVRHVLSNSSGFGGQNAALVITSACP